MLGKNIGKRLIVFKANIRHLKMWIVSQIEFDAIYDFLYIRYNML